MMEGRNKMCLNGSTAQRRKGATVISVERGESDKCCGNGFCLCAIAPLAFAPFILPLAILKKK